MAVPEAVGGWGASLLDLALVAEEIGRALAPAPVVETQVAARLAGRGGSSGPASETVAAALAGDRLVTMALHPPRAGVATLVPAGAICDALIVPVGARLLLVSPEAAARRTVANLGSAPLADIEVDGGVELALGRAAGELFEAALDEWLVLTAAALVGLATAAHEIVCTYAAERRAFGAVIGSYQGVAHPLADDATALDGARLLSRKAAWALDTGHERGRELASMAFAFASETAERPPTTPSTSTAATASCWSTTCSSTTAGPAAGRGSGVMPKRGSDARVRPLWIAGRGEDGGPVKAAR